MFGYLYNPTYVGPTCERIRIRTCVRLCVRTCVCLCVRTYVRMSVRVSVDLMFCVSTAERNTTRKGQRRQKTRKTTKMYADNIREWTGLEPQKVCNAAQNSHR